jgi:ribosome-associated heat shock protein Hsp15
MGKIEDSEEGDRVRLDKWLWAARFYKTRALAAQAIEGGRIEVNGDRAKRARPLRPGDQLLIRLGPYQHHVMVTALSNRRGPAAEAATLYQETAESREARERRALELRSVAPLFHGDKGRPTKKDRRDINRLRGRDD